MLRLEVLVAAATAVLLLVKSPRMMPSQVNVGAPVLVPMLSVPLGPDVLVPPVSAPMVMVLAVKVPVSKVKSLTLVLPGLLVFSPIAPAGAETLDWKAARSRLLGIA